MRTWGVGVFLCGEVGGGGSPSHCLYHYIKPMIVFDPLDLATSPHTDTLPHSTTMCYHSLSASLASLTKPLPELTPQTATQTAPRFSRVCSCDKPRRCHV